tara:strand:- start:28878 stop:29114 length:237 start_codon:yes stop_codon:yes gene_type:complete
LECFTIASKKSRVFGCESCPTRVSPTAENRGVLDVENIATPDLTRIAQHFACRLSESELEQLADALDSIPEGTSEYRD